MEDLYCIKQVMKGDNVIKIIKVLRTREFNFYYAPLTCSHVEDFAMICWKEINSEERFNRPLAFTHELQKSKSRESCKWRVIRPSSTKATVYVNKKPMVKNKYYDLKNGTTIKIKYPGLAEPVDLIYEVVNPAVDLENVLAERDQETKQKAVMEKRIIEDAQAWENRMKDIAETLELVQSIVDETTNSLETERQNSTSLREEIELLQCQLSERDMELEEANASARLPFRQKLGHFNDEIESVLAQLQSLQTVVVSLYDKCHEDEKDNDPEINYVKVKIKEFNSQLDKLHVALVRQSVRLRDELNEYTEEFVKLRDQPSSYPETLSKGRFSYFDVWNQLEQLQNKLKRSFAEELKCTICHEIAESPAILNCSHSFCSECINTWKTTRMDCPTCRIPIVQQVSSLALKNIIKTFKDEM